jgi:hypothetical protein
MTSSFILRKIPITTCVTDYDTLNSLGKLIPYDELRHFAEQAGRLEIETRLPRINNALTLQKIKTPIYIKEGISRFLLRNQKNFPVIDIVQTLPSVQIIHYYLHSYVDAPKFTRIDTKLITAINMILTDFANELVTKVDESMNELITNEGKLFYNQNGIEKDYSELLKEIEEKNVY